MGKLTGRDKPEVARKLLPAIRRVFEHARVQLKAEHGIVMLENPADWRELKARGFRKLKELSRGRHPSLPYALMAVFMPALRARDATAARALEFLILKADVVRTSPNPALAASIG